MKRKLLFGLTLMCALGSIYAGMLEWGPRVQYGLLGLSVVLAIVALRTPAEES